MGWKIFFWIYFILTILSFASIPAAPPATTIDLLGLPFTLVELVALFSYAYQKHILSQKQWKVLLYAYLLFFILCMSGELTPLGDWLPMLKSSQFSILPPAQRIAAAALTFVLFLPLVYVLKQLAYGKSMKARLVKQRSRR